MRARPASGSSLLKSGTSGLRVKFQPPAASAAANASEAETAPSGSSTIIQAQLRSARRWVSRPGWASR